MKPSDIKVGKTYINRGAGRTRREVIAIESQADFRARPPLGVFGIGDLGNVIIVYRQLSGDNIGRVYGLSLASFAAWAGKEVTE